MDSFTVSISCENVLISWAAANAFLPISVVSSAYLPSVVVSTSVDIQAADNESLKFLVAVIVSLNAPFAPLVNTVYVPSAFFSRLPISTAVSISCCLNSLVAILAFSIDFQSISFT